MIIWGSKGRTTTITSGEFYCPDCKDYKPYNHQKVKRWFTLYFIPVFPLSDLGEYIECSGCKATYKNNVLDFDPKKQQREFQALFAIATRDIMLKIALADGVVEDEELKQTIASFEKITNREISQQQLLEALEELKKDDTNISNYALSISPYLNHVGKEMVLRAAIAVSKSDGKIQNEELEMVHSLAVALDLPRTYANGIFHEESIRPLK
jgi:tellurite resistance protein|tara:strand:- start:806 stop:1435 length:630 start_codon:yes stop_codon:yes gene_type:complete